MPSDGDYFFFTRQTFPAMAGLGALAYSLGLRHAFDADHNSAIDDTARLLIQKGKQPFGVGFFFSLGHSTVPSHDHCGGGRSHEHAFRDAGI